MSGRKRKKQGEREGWPKREKYEERSGRSEKMGERAGWPEREKEVRRGKDEARDGGAREEREGSVMRQPWCAVGKGEPSSAMLPQFAKKKKKRRTCFNVYFFYINTYLNIIIFFPLYSENLYTLHFF